MFTSPSFFYQSSNNDSLTSKVEKTHTTYKRQNKFKPQSSEFTYTIEGTTITTKKSLDHLTNLGEQSITQWIKNTKHSLQLFQWTDEVASKITISIIGLNILPHGNYNSPDEIFKTLIKKHFTKQTKLILNKRLYEIFQHKNINIQTYYQKIVAAAEDLAIINNETNLITQKKIKEVFLKNLNKNTKLLALDKDLSEPLEIVEYISQRDEIIQEDRMRFRNNSNKKNFTSNSEKNKKYCKYHKTNYHSTEECNFLKNKEKNKDSSAYSFSEILPKFKLPTINTQINNLTNRALIDTGATENFISKKLVNKLNLKTRKIKSRKIELANTAIVETSEMVNIELKIKNSPNTIYKIKALVIKESGYDILLGNEFLKEFNVIINYKTANINIDGTEIDLDEPEFDHNEEDKKLISKTKIFCLETENSIKENIKKEIIEKYKENNPELGNINNFSHKIEVTDDKLLKFKQYKVPEKYKETVEKEIQKLLKFNIIKHSNSEYCSAAFPIIKRNKEIRLVIDYRELNTKTRKMPYPIPTIREILQDFKKSKIFSTIDLSMGYYQIPMEEKSKKFTAFVINNKQYEFNRMPFGLKNAPMTFQMTMNKIFGHLPFIKIYLDDIIIFSEDINQHKIHLKKVLEIANQNKISINYDKSKFCKKEINFLGNRISQEGIKPTLERIENLEIPNNIDKKKLQRILGCINWYRPYIPNLSIKLINITEKLKHSTIQWSEEDQQIIKNIIDEINKKPLLKFPDFTKDFILETDASNTAIGGVLKQEENMIDCYSQKLQGSQINYSVMEKELLAILKGLEKFRNIILGSKIIIYTDNSNILSNKLHQTPRIKRWKYLLNEYEYEIQHIKGKQNNQADILSRIYNISYKIQAKDKNNKLNISDDKLEKFIKEKHTEFGHPNSIKLINTLKRSHSNKNLIKKIKEYSEKCLECAREKKNKRLYKMKSLSHTANKFNQRVCSDIYGPISPKTFNLKSNGNIYFFLFVDTYTKLTRVYATRSITAQDLINCMNKWIKEFSKPSTIFSDRGKQYTSEIFDKYCKNLEVKKIFTPPYSPRSNGLVERKNSSLGNIIRIFRGKPIKFILKKAHNFFNRLCINKLNVTPEELVNNKGKIEHSTKTKFIPSGTSKINKYTKPEVRINDKVFIYRPTTSKTDSPYIGPFTIKGILKEQNAVIVEDKKKSSIESLHNVKRIAL